MRYSRGGDGDSHHRANRTVRPHPSPKAPGNRGAAAFGLRVGVHPLQHSPDSAAALSPWPGHRMGKLARWGGLAPKKCRPLSSPTDIRAEEV